MLWNSSYQVGLLNAWLGPAISWMTLLFLVAINPKAVKRLNDMSWYNKRDKLASGVTMVIMIAIMAVSVWIPLQPDTVWFNIGVLIFAVGVVLNLIALYNYGATPDGEPIQDGLYRISRHPLYLCWTIMLIGICLASASWLLFILSIIYHIPNHFLILGEERYCVEEYGESYRSSMDKIPRYLFFHSNLGQGR